MIRHPLLDLENRTTTKMRANQYALGVFLLSGNSMIAEAVATLPIDWLVVDMEASPVTKEGAIHVMQALNGSGVTPLIRVPACDRHLIEHALDAGAHGVIVPKIDTPKAAARAAAASRYPPRGARGINPVRSSAYFSNIPEYLRLANDRTLCIVQIESIEAVERAPEIAAVDGIDGLFIGVGDLASAFGHPGVITSSRMDDARQRVLRAAADAGKFPGIFAYSTELALQYAREGFRFIAIGNDIKAIRESMQGTITHFRDFITADGTPRGS